jgi:hypothetical protein
MPSERVESPVYKLSGEPFNAIDHMILDGSSGRHYAALRFSTCSAAVIDIIRCRGQSSSMTLGWAATLRISISAGCRRHRAIGKGSNRNLPTSGASMAIAARTHSPHEHKPVDRLGYEGVDSTTVSFCTAATVGAVPALTNAIFAATGVRIRRLPCQRTSRVPREALGKALGARCRGRSRDHGLGRLASARSYPCAIEGREWGTVEALITPDKGEVHPLSEGTLKLRSVGGAGRGSRNTGRSRLALPSCYAGLLHGSVAWVRVGS